MSLPALSQNLVASDLDLDPDSTRLIESLEGRFTRLTDCIWDRPELYKLNRTMNSFMRSFGAYTSKHKLNASRFSAHDKTAREYTDAVEAFDAAYQNLVHYATPAIMRVNELASEYCGVYRCTEDLEPMITELKTLLETTKSSAAKTQKALVKQTDGPENLETSQPNSGDAQAACTNALDPSGILPLAAECISASAAYLQVLQDFKTYICSTTGLFDAVVTCERFVKDHQVNPGWITGLSLVAPVYLPEAHEFQACVGEQEEDFAELAFAFKPFLMSYLHSMLVKSTQSFSAPTSKSVISLNVTWPLPQRSVRNNDKTSADNTAVKALSVRRNHRTKLVMLLEVVERYAIHRIHHGLDLAAMLADAPYIASTEQPIPDNTTREMLQGIIKKFEKFSDDLSDKHEVMWIAFEKFIAATKKLEGPADTYEPDTESEGYVSDTSETPDVV